MRDLVWALTFESNSDETPKEFHLFLPLRFHPVPSRNADDAFRQLSASSKPFFPQPLLGIFDYVPSAYHVCTPPEELLGSGLVQVWFRSGSGLVDAHMVQARRSNGETEEAAGDGCNLVGLRLRAPAVDRRSQAKPSQAGGTHVAS